MVVAPFFVDFEFNLKGYTAFYLFTHFLIVPLCVTASAENERGYYTPPLLMKFVNKNLQSVRNY